MRIVRNDLGAATAMMIDQLNRYLRHQLQELRIGGVTWRYRDCGHGDPTVLLLPGFVGGGDAWFPLVGPLQDRFRFLVPDYAAVTKATELEAGLMAILTAEHVDTFALAGQSFGGLLAQFLVRRHQQRVQSLVLCHAGPPRTAELPSLRWRIAVGNLLPMSAHRLQWRRRITADWPNKSEQHRFWRQFFIDRIERLSRAELLGLGHCYRDLLRHCEFAPNDLSNWSGRTLVLESADDPVVSGEERAALRQMYPAAQVHRFEDAGHSSLIARPAEVVDRFRSFLDGDDCVG